MTLCERHSRLRCGECAYVEELKQDNQDLADKYNRDIYALEAKVEEMQKTLEWYADTSNHSPFSSLMREDCGERARQTLKGDPNESLTRNSNSR